MGGPILGFRSSRTSTTLAQAGLKFMKDRPNLGKVGQVIHIKPLYYPTLDDLLEEVCRQVMLKCAIEGLSITHNPLTGRISFEWKHGTLNFLSFDKYFFSQIGLGTEQVEIFSKPLFMLAQAGLKFMKDRPTLGKVGR